MRQELVQDSWLTLLSGREIARNGLPHRDDLFAWTSGRTWTDQQWLAHLGFYWAYLAGGIRLVLAAHVACIVGAAAIVVTAARRRGASGAAVLLTAFVCLLIAPWALQLRAQSPAELLFAACLALLVDPRPLTGGRIAAILAVLALWANVHGTVVLGVGLAVLRGLALVRWWPRRGLALVALAPACIFASPYAPDLVGYYHRLLANPLLPRFVDEWRRSTPSSRTAVFYVVLLGGVWLLARQRDLTTSYEKVAFALLALGALQAVRGIVWFGLAAVPLLAPLLDGVVSRVRVLRGAAPARAGLGVAAAAVAMTVVVFARPAGWFVDRWPAEAARTVAAAAARDPSLRVFAADRYSDWLLWSEPSLRGRIAYDIRFELLTSRELDALSAPLRGYGLVVSEPGSKSCFASRCRLVYRDGDVVVARPRS